MHQRKWLPALSMPISISIDHLFINQPLSIGIQCVYYNCSGNLTITLTTYIHYVAAIRSLVTCHISRDMMHGTDWRLWLYSWTILIYISLKILNYFHHYMFILTYVSQNWNHYLVAGSDVRHKRYVTVHSQPTELTRSVPHTPSWERITTV